MNRHRRNVAVVMLLAGLTAGCWSNDSMEMLEDRGVPDVSTLSADKLESHLGQDVKIAGTAVASKWSNTGVQAGSGRLWEVQIRTLDAWPSDVLGRKVHVKGVLRVQRQTLDANGNPVNESGEIVQGVPGVRDLFYLADCIYERD
jgi:hypothetical protein